MNEILLIIILIFVGQTLGSLIGIIKKPNDLFLRASLAFAGSMMLGISFLQLIPEGLKISSPLLITSSFIFGIMIMRFVDRILPHINPELMKKEKPSIKRSVTMLVIGIALHNIPEGLAIGVGFALSPVLGIVVALGIAMQDVPENIATIVPLYGLTKKRLKSFIILVTTVLFELFGFVFGYYILHGTVPNLLGASLALAAGFMTYISIEELIPSAQIKKDPYLMIISMIFGVLAVLGTMLFVL